MKIPRDLDAADLISVLCRHFSDARVHQVGSHLILWREKRIKSAYSAKS